ncbi:hypothetical protein PIB30_070159 [Stylosanthes scabra]|uniref:Uncharacterized protein n=1 Tax=Stylosanthes scabra TaxID=79078 RepID=A0ABU6RND9_9FABA|nr:hypothetical protein [Stylosanthes scabra]
MEGKEEDVSMKSSSMDIIEASLLRQILHAIQPPLIKRVDEMEKGILESKKSPDKLVFLQFKIEKHQNDEESNNTNENTSAKKSFGDIKRKSFFQLHAKSNQTCFFTELFDEDGEVEILNTMPQQGLPTGIFGAGKSKSKPKQSFLANGMTRIMHEPVSKIEK